jgi:hypothetical protein
MRFDSDRVSRHNDSQHAGPYERLVRIRDRNGGVDSNLAQRLGAGSFPRTMPNPARQLTDFAAQPAARAIDEPVPAALSAPPNNAARGSNSAKKSRLLSPAGVFAVAVLTLICIGLRVPTERYLTPQRGIGYALGIVGGSMMLLLLLYSARKRMRWLRFLGPTPSWFRYHMLLGVLGPLCILYHANFGLGATNSNVAFFSMLTVAGSGLVGRYIYARIHHGLYGSKLTLAELQRRSEDRRAAPGTFAFLPDLLSRLETVEKRILATGPRLPLLAAVKLALLGVTVPVARLQMHAHIRKSLRIAADGSAPIAAERKRLQRTAFAYVNSRIAATRRVAGFQAYERLFSLWHALHLPLIFVLIVAAIVHVIAVNIY